MKTAIKVVVWLAAAGITFMGIGASAQGCVAATAISA